MFKVATLLTLAVCLTQTAYPQESGAKLLLDASHCLVTEKQNWISIQKRGPTALDFGYVIDTESDPGTNHIYVIYYENADRSRGKVFDLLYRHRGSHITLDVQNNASFTKSGKGIVFVDPPLGGTWTQTHLLSAIKQAGRKASTILSVGDVSASFPGVSCKSYVKDR